MILDGSHKKWCIATLLLFLLASCAYVAYVRSALGGPRGGSVPGMLFGIAGSALMIYAGLISARKKVPTWRVGSAQAWLRGHIWLGLLSVPLILFHAGFRWGGLLEQVLLLVMAAIVASGLVGLALQQLLPREMTARVPLETFYAQLPFECRLLQVEGDVAVAAVCGPLSVEPDREIGNESRLKALGVKSPGRHQPLLAAVYRVASDGVSDEPTAKPAHAAPKAAVVVSSPPADNPDVKSEPPKALSAAEKIAAMRAAKQTAPKSPEPAATTGEAGAATEDKAPKPKLSAADKIALMRSTKKTPTSDSAPRPSPPPEENSAVPAVETASEVKTKPLSAADKIALMRAGKKPAVSVTAEVKAPTPTAEGELQKKLSAADKIAMMRAAKGTKPAPDEVEPATAAAAVVESAPAKLSAADKIAMMRAKKPATPSATQVTETPAASEPPPKKVANEAAPKSLAEPKPLDAESRKRAVGELQKFYVESVRPFLDYHSLARGALASEVNAGGVFAAVGAGLPDDLRAALDRLVALCDKRRQLRVQERVHRWLHGWLFVHVPLSFALLGLGILHVVMSLYY